MTRLNYQRGRDLDAQIGEKVMLLPPPHPRYSSDISEAWKVVQMAGITSLIQMNDGLWMARVNDAANYMSYYERPTGGDLMYDEPDFGDTPSHAICLAALRAAELAGEEKKENTQTP